MLFLDTSNATFVVENRHQLIAALLTELNPEAVDLVMLAATCLDVDPLDVVIVEM